MSDQVALNLIAGLALQEFALLFRLDSFGDDAQLELVCHRDDRAGDRRVLFLLNLGNERPIDLDGTEWKVSQMAEDRVLTAEIVDRDSHAEGG